MDSQQATPWVDHSPDALVMIDVDGLVAEWNPAAEALFGWSRAEILHQPIRQVVPAVCLAHFEKVWDQLAAGDTVPEYDTLRLHRSGALKPVSVHVAAVFEQERLTGIVASFRQLPDPAVLEPPQEFGSSASGAPWPDQVQERDGLTGLLSRASLQRHLAEPLAAHTVRGVVVLNVDAFALINQTYGPDAGDEVLRELGRRLSRAADPAVIGRWQADEFVCVLDEERPERPLAALAAALQDAVRAPLLVGQERLHVTMSAGLVTSALAPDADLFQAAAAATRVAKQTGRDRAVWFDPEQHPTSGGGLRLMNDLRHGIDHGELRLHYQPIIDLTDGRPVGVEALVRWERAGAGLLAPGEFIELAERTGQIIALGAWVTRQACRVAVDLILPGAGPARISINISARQLNDPGLIAMLTTALRDSGCPPSSIDIEVTETALMGDMHQATRTLLAVKALGISLALDDFGTGYSSLLYLKHFPVDRIKIDQSFVQGLGTNDDDTAIVAATISLAHSVGVLCVAEGVETEDQLDLLRRLGCDYAQGYLFSRPLTLEQLEQWQPHDLVPARPPEGLELGSHNDRILSLHREGASLHTIAAALNLDGIRTAHGSRWTAHTVAKTITTSPPPISRSP